MTTEQTETVLKRDPEETLPEEPEAKKAKLTSDGSEDEEVGEDGMKPISRGPMSKARENRLEQNRKAARESRRRKKLMIEELQRSVIFFSKANGALKMQNEELGRTMMDAQSRIAAIEAGKEAPPAEKPEPIKEPEQPKPAPPAPAPTPQYLNEQVQAQAVATQAMYESQGFPAGAARAVAQAMNASAPAPTADGSVPPGGTLPPMQPGSTMQAMAAFQQAAAAAMQAAMGMNPAGGNPQQVYADAMNAFAQQAGQAQFAAQQTGMQPTFMSFPHGMAMPIAWQQAAQQQQPVKQVQQQQQQQVVAVEQQQQQQQPVPVAQLQQEQPAVM